MRVVICLCGVFGGCFFCEVANHLSSAWNWLIPTKPAFCHVAKAESQRLRAAEAAAIASLECIETEKLELERSIGGMNKAKRVTEKAAKDFDQMLLETKDIFVKQQVRSTLRCAVQCTSNLLEYTFFLFVSFLDSLVRATVCG